jgi:hypothetical protein
MKIIKNYLYIAVAIFLIPTHLNAAEFYEQYSPSSPKNSPMACGYELTIKGSIQKGDAQKLKRVLDDACYEKSRYKISNLVTYTITLSSDGGDVSEAMQMGRVIRAKGGITQVWPADNCSSSCVFVLAGGQMRMPMGKIGIHRPYFSNLNPNASISDIQQAREKLSSEIAKYFRDMDIASSLTDEMMSIPPEKIKILTQAQLESYRLKGTDAAYEEKTIAEFASAWNLSSAEYRKRDLASDSECGFKAPPDKQKNRGWQICRWSIMLNISRGRAEQKVDTWINSCPKEGPQRDACVKSLKNSN